MIRPVTQNAYDCLLLDIWPRPAAIVDFGLNSDDHYAALKYAVKQGATIQELDAALGDGPKLTALVERYGSKIQFKTAYDMMLD